MKKVYLIYNNVMEKVILNPQYANSRKEFGDFDLALRSQDPKKKIIVYTNMPEMIEKEKHKNIVDVLRIEK